MSGASASAAAPRPDHYPVKRAASPKKWRWLRVVLLAAGMASLLAGLWGGLVRLGVTLPATIPTLAKFHGALMICGFLGTVISLERAVAIGRWWAYTAPLLSAIGAIVLIIGAPIFAGANCSEEQETVDVGGKTGALARVGLHSITQRSCTKPRFCLCQNDLRFGYEFKVLRNVGRFLKYFMRVRQPGAR
jgi:hypothetical protein